MIIVIIFIIIIALLFATGNIFQCRQVYVSPAILVVLIVFNG